MTQPAADATTAPPAAAPPAAAPSAAAAVRAAGARAVAAVRAALAAAAAALLGALTAAMRRPYERCVGLGGARRAGVAAVGRAGARVLKGRCGHRTLRARPTLGASSRPLNRTHQFSAPAAAAAAEGGEASPLKELVAEARRAYDVKHVYAWHALHGYWRGASADARRGGGRRRRAGRRRCRRATS